MWLNGLSVWPAVALGQWRRRQPVGLPATHVAGQLSAAVAARAPEVGQHHPAIELAARKVVKALEYAADVLVPLGIAVRERAGKITSCVAFKNSCSCAMVRSLASSMSITIQG